MSNYFFLPGDLRVCTYCCKIVLSYLQTADLNSDLTDDLRSVQEDLQSRFGGSSHDTVMFHGVHSGGIQAGHSSGAYRSLQRRKPSLGYQEEKFANSRSLEPTFDSIAGDEAKSLGDWVSLKALWNEMCNPVTGIDWATHRHNMTQHHNSCVVGSELVDWLLAQRKVTLRSHGIQIGQMLIDMNLLECVSQVSFVCDHLSP